MNITEALKIASSFFKHKPLEAYEINSGYIVKFGNGFDDLAFVNKKTKEAEVLFPPDLPPEEFNSKRRVF